LSAFVLNLKVPEEHLQRKKYYYSVSPCHADYVVFRYSHYLFVGEKDSFFSDPAVYYGYYRYPPTSFYY
jgi:hypothetical protein